MTYRQSVGCICPEKRFSNSRKCQGKTRAWNILAEEEGNGPLRMPIDVDQLSRRKESDTMRRSCDHIQGVDAGDDRL